MRIKLLQEASIKLRLLGLGLLSGLLMVALFITTYWSDRRVAQANHAIDAAQAVIQTANDSVAESLQFKDTVTRLQQEVMQLRLLEKRFLQTHDAALSARFQELSRQLTAGLAAVKLGPICEQAQEYAGAFAERGRLAAAHDALNGKMAEPLQQSEKRLAEIMTTLEAKQAQLQMEGGTLKGDEAEMMNVVRDCRIVFLRLQTLQQQFTSTGDQKYVAQYRQVAKEDAQAGLRSLQEFSTALNNTNFVAASRDISASLDEFLKRINESLDFGARERQLEAQMETSGESILVAASQQLDAASQKVVGLNQSVLAANQQMQQARSSAAATRKSAMLAVIGIVVAGLIIGGGLNFAIITSINRALQQLINRLSGAMGQTTLAANQVSASSQSLAEGASEQAASLEETSASLEEISSMTRRNAENAAHSTSLSQQASQSAAAGLGRLTELSRTLAAIKSAVSEMQAAVSEMQSSSLEISKIIKTIDEIAFQTNLLALNAAVEAARAGEAGAGFAVVADEVRALAQRSAQAAKDTSDKIEAAVKRSELGGVASTKVVTSLGEVEATAHSIGQVFNGIVTQIKSLDDVISEIAAASKEQSQGVSEVNMAVSQMDKVTQSNAASAEENASAGEELNAQVGSLQSVVVELQAVVSGSRPAANESNPAAHPASEARPVGTTAPKPKAFAKAGPSQPAPALPPPVTVPAGDRQEMTFQDF